MIKKIGFFLVCGWMAFSASSAFAGPVYYVDARSGLDDNDGSERSPFRTIQRAARVAAPDTIVVIRSGTYRETVRPVVSGTQENPIIFWAEPGAEVFLTGNEPIDPESFTQDGILPNGRPRYSTQVPFDSLGELKDQVFIGRQGQELEMMQLASFPTNLSSDPFMHPDVGLTDSADITDTAWTIHSSILQQPADFWRGAFYVGNGMYNWGNQVSNVEASAPGSVTVSHPDDTGFAYLQPARYSTFSIFGLQALDHEKEYYVTTERGGTKLYLAFNPRGYRIEMKRRNLAFDLTDRSYIYILGPGEVPGRAKFEIFASTLHAEGVSRGNIIWGLLFNYPSFDWNLRHGPYSYATEADPPTGIRLGGAYNIFGNNRIFKSSGHGIFTFGAGHQVVNNLIAWFNYAGTDCAGIAAYAEETLFAYNTMIKGGGAAITAYGAENQFRNNNIMLPALRRDDVGGIYGFAATDNVFQENVINDLHCSYWDADPQAPGGWTLRSVKPSWYTGKMGFYLDGGNNRNNNIRNNLFFNIDCQIPDIPPELIGGIQAMAMYVSGGNNYNLIYNNTFLNSSVTIDLGGGDHLGTRAINNLAHGYEWPLYFSQESSPEERPFIRTNFENLAESPFLDLESVHTGLRPGAPVIDQGTAVFPGEPFHGRGPDPGWIEHNPDNPAYHPYFGYYPWSEDDPRRWPEYQPLARAGLRSVIYNSGFERIYPEGPLDFRFKYWTKSGQVIYQLLNLGDFSTRTGMLAVLIGPAQGRVEQRVSGLRLNEPYELTGWVRGETNATVEVGITSGAVTEARRITFTEGNTGWRRVIIPVRPGAEDGAVSCAGTGNGQVLCDDFGLATPNN